MCPPYSEGIYHQYNNYIEILKLLKVKIAEEGLTSGGIDIELFVNFEWEWRTSDKFGVKTNKVSISLRARLEMVYRMVYI